MYHDTLNREVNMLEIKIINRKGLDVVDSRLLHKKLEVKSYHADWIRRRIDGYGFMEGKDYFISKMSKSIGRPTLDYLVSLDMAKELAMLENNEIGKKTRRYFIKAEKQLRKHESIRLATIETRKTLTDKIQESGENERMHGHGYSTYTRLVYSLVGLDERYKTWKVLQKNGKSNFRDSLLPGALKMVELAESIIKPLIEMEKQYSEIKETVEPIFKKKSKDLLEVKR